MADVWQYTLVENDTDTEFTIEYEDDRFLLGPKGVVVRFGSFTLMDTLLPRIWFMTGAVQLKPLFSIWDLLENAQITIFRDAANTYSCRMTPRTFLNNLKLNCQGSFKSNCCSESIGELVKFHLRRMEDLQRKVRIWHNQCHYLLKKFQEGVERAHRAFQTVVHVDFEVLYQNSYHRAHQHSFGLLRPVPNSLSDECMHYTFLRCMAEGEALLLSCGKHSYNRAALALSSPPPSVPTFSKFALAIRELDWIVDFLCCDPEEKSRVRSWKWCAERCRPVSFNCRNGLDALEDDSLGADVRRQNADRGALKEALEESLHQKLSKSHGNSSLKFLSPMTSWVPRGNTTNQDEFGPILRKRLDASSCPPGSPGCYSPLDAFVIDSPETCFVEHSVGSSRNRASKSVLKCKWLGETVALSTMSNVSKVSAKAETGFLARVQHPNVVEWMGYAFKEDIRDPNCYRDFYIVTEHMESDLHDLITQQLTNADGTIVKDRPPFRFLVAVDIALQVVEAMIHVHKCRVLHRDLKPKNVLATPKYSPPAHSKAPFLCSDVLIFYTVKLIDFGSSKTGDDGSHFHTRKQGTPKYMAPEVWESEDSYSWSADVYSFGLTCYEIFHGRLPYKRAMTPTFANIQKVMRGKLWFPFAYPGELEVLIEKCCAQNPSHRPSFEDIREALWWLKFLPVRKIILNCSRDL